ncbi:MAG: hypothetical protein NT031_18755 [Planctomycetota bacterium]|nr:hypothetical protein [Planctomycetota bacterium]
MTDTIKKTSGYSTQWAGQFYVAAELTRRGYTVAFPLGRGSGATENKIQKVPTVAVAGVAGDRTGKSGENSCGIALYYEWQGVPLGTPGAGEQVKGEQVTEPGPIHEFRLTIHARATGYSPASPETRLNHW